MPWLSQTETNVVDPGDLLGTASTTLDRAPLDTLGLHISNEADSVVRIKN